MNPRRSAADLSPKTFNHRKRNNKLQWTALFAESVQALMNPKLTDRARVAWLLLQPVLGAGNGYLLEDGEPVGIQRLANKIWRDADQLNADLGKLIKYDVLRRRDDGVIFDPVMVNDRDSQTFATTTGVGDQNETYLNRYSSLSENEKGSVPQYSTVHNSTVFVAGSRRQPRPPATKTT